jgi:hypothetical protein
MSSSTTSGRERVYAAPRRGDFADDKPPLPQAAARQAA